MESEDEPAAKGKQRSRKSFKFKFNRTGNESVLQADVERISSSMSAGKNTKKPVPAPRVTGSKNGGALVASEQARLAALELCARISSVDSRQVECAVGASRGSPAHASESEREETVVRTSYASYALNVRATPSLPMPAQVCGESVTLRAKDARASTDRRGETSILALQSTQAVAARGVSPTLMPARKVNARVTLGGSCARKSPTSAISTGTGCGTPATQKLRGSTINTNWCDIMDDDARCESLVVSGGASGALAGASTPADVSDVATMTSRVLDSAELESMDIPEAPRVPSEGPSRLDLKRKSKGGKQFRTANPSTSASPSEDGDSGSEGGKRRCIYTAPAPAPRVTLPAGASALVSGKPVAASPSALPCAPSLDTLSRRASELSQEMTAYCLDETKKINKSQMAVITAKFGEMDRIIGDLLFLNARLEGRVTELTKTSPGVAADRQAGGPLIESRRSYSDLLKSSPGRTGAGQAPPVTSVTVRVEPALAKTAAASPATSKHL